MTAWDDIRFEWTRGTFRLSTEDSITVMGRVAELERRMAVLEGDEARLWALIAEAAALPPIVELENQSYECFWCRGEGDYFTDTAEHTADCLWLRFKAASAPDPSPDGPERHTDPTVTATSQENS